MKNLENNITALYKDARNNVWIGTSNGLYKKSDG
ncbi:MAG: two-component regulator propeller domain-containing protein [Paludibacter sp.]